MAELAVTLFDFNHYSNSVPPKIFTNIEINSDALFYVNIISQALHDGIGRLPDARPVGLKPIETAHVADFPVFKSSGFLLGNITGSA